MRASWTCAVVALAFLVASCDGPFGLGLPTTRAIESGVVDSLNASPSLEIRGSYQAEDERWTIDLKISRPSESQMSVASANEHLDAIVFGDTAFFRGQQYLSDHLASDPAARYLVALAGNAWWTGLALNAPTMGDFTDGEHLRTTFLGAAVQERRDHIATNGVDAVELSGPRADVFIAEAAPHQLLRVRLRHGAIIDGIVDADFAYSSFGKDFGIAKPADVLDFGDLSSLPPEYTVVSVDTTSCGAPTCAVSALVQNLGGSSGAIASSSVAFTLTDLTSGRVLGTCTAVIRPDVGYDSTTTASCVIDGLSGTSSPAWSVSAEPTNPGHG